jgi:hypothetical protein
LADIAIENNDLSKLDHVNVLADKGYHTGEEIRRCTENEITTYVSPRSSSSNNEELYPIEKFVYNESGESYTTKACKTCRLKEHCTKSVNGRTIDRSEYAGDLEANNRRVLENPDYYKRRQQITEHIFGTLKRQRGFTHTLVRGKDNVLGEVGLMFIGYNLTRCVKILSATKLIKLLRESCFFVFDLINRLILSLFRDFLIPGSEINIRGNCITHAL